MDDERERTETAAAELFGDRLGVAQRYVDLLRGPGVERGLIGPREGDRIWSRHVLNSAVIGDLVPASARVVDVGSGAGLPGIPLALARPDLTVTLVEPMQRRCEFLTECVGELGLGGVEVVRGRAEELVDVVAGDVVTARAVARLDKLLRWVLPLTKSDGQVLAIKGASVEKELEQLGVAGSDEARRPNCGWRRRGVDAVHVMQIGWGIIDPPATVVRVTRGPRG